ncbi:MAG TPA: hypothetical protein VJZ71_20125 [Phycisphaerae bacterium]|nr:hypothetical protein [Phycisphaerae bacterium]
MEERPNGEPLVTREGFDTSRRAVEMLGENHGLGEIIRSQWGSEPVLTGESLAMLERVAGQMALAKLSPDLIEIFFSQMLVATFTAIYAVRRGYYEYWKDLMENPSRRLPNSTRRQKSKPPGQPTRGSESGGEPGDKTEGHHPGLGE